MEFSEIFGFLIIIKDSFKLLFKNGKSMASITILSLLLPSIIFLLFINFYQSLTNHMTDSIINSSDADSTSFYQQTILYIIILLVVEIAALSIYALISQVSGIATILVTAMSYTDKQSSLQHLFPRIQTTWRRLLSNTFRRPKNRPARFAFVGIFAATLLVALYHNPVAIGIAIVIGVLVCVYQLYSSVVWVLCHVVSIVEEVYEGAAALERAELLVKGQRHHGFMMNLFFNLVILIGFLGCWMGFGDKGDMNLTAYGLIFVNTLSLGKIFGCLMYTVFYFQCKKIHGGDVGNFEYVKLPTVNLGGDNV